MGIQAGLSKVAGCQQKSLPSSLVFRLAFSLHCQPVKCRKILTNRNFPTTLVQVMVGFSFPYCVRKLHKFLYPITEHRKAKPKKGDLLSTQLKTVLWRQIIKLTATNSTAVADSGFSGLAMIWLPWFTHAHKMAKDMNLHIDLLALCGTSQEAILRKFIFPL